MPVIQSHVPGTFCWAELASVDASKSASFFRDLFGWTTQDIPLPEGGVYSMCLLEGNAVAALYQQWPQQREQGCPSNFMAYISVTSADEAFAKAVELGAKPLSPPMDVMEEGRMAVIMDPTGAPVGLWEAKRHIGSTVMQEPGSVGWCELDAHGVEQGVAFYSALFGWQPNTGDFGAIRYTSFMRGPQPLAGAMELPPGLEQAPSNWLVYFLAKDVDAVVARTLELGGNVAAPAQDMPGGRFAVLVEPTGAVFGVIHFSMPA